MSTQGSTKFKPGDRIQDLDGDQGTVVPEPDDNVFVVSGEVWARWDGSGEVLWVHEDDCTLIEPAAPPELDRLRALNAKLVAALKPFALVAEHDIGADEHDCDHFHPMSPTRARGPVLRNEHFREARAVIAEAQEVDRVG